MIKKAQPETLAAASTTPSHTAIIPVPQGRTSAPCSQRLSQRLCTLLAAAVFPVSNFWRDRAHFWPFLLPVFGFSRDREHLKKCFRTFFCMFGVLLGISCSGPGSYEEFVRAEDATGGVYEFVIPSEAKESGEAKEPSLRAMAPLGGKSRSFDLSFYTAPLDEPLQLEITWYSVEANQLNTNKLPETSLQPELSRRFCESADNQAVTLHAIRRETVWFPAGQHKALYRSGVSLDNSINSNYTTRASAGPSPIQGIFGEGTSVLPPTFPNSGQKRGRSQASGQDLPQKQGKMGKVESLLGKGESKGPQIQLQVRPIDPPEDFRGLGIIIKRNDGTR